MRVLRDQIMLFLPCAVTWLLAELSLRAAKLQREGAIGAFFGRIGVSDVRALPPQHGGFEASITVDIPNSGLA
jgi:hypothetical protein